MTIKKIICTGVFLSLSTSLYAGVLGSSVYYDETHISQFAQQTGNEGIDHGYPLIDHYAQLKPTFNLSKPITTGRWWTPLLAAQLDTNKITNFLIFNPFRAIVSNAGVSLGIPIQKNFPIDNGSAGINQGNFNRGYSETLDMTVSTDNLTNTTPMVSDYSDWSVNVDWVANNNSALKVIMTEGSPFIFFTKKKSQAFIYLNFTNTNQAILLATEPGISLFKIINNSDVSQAHYYALYTYPDTPPAWIDTQGNNISLNDNMTKTIQLKDNHAFFTLATIPAKDDLAAKALAITMQSFAFSFITNTAVAYQYHPDQSIVETNFNITTKNVYPDISGLSDQPLIMLYPWQIDHLNTVQKQNCLFAACDTTTDSLATLYGNMHLFNPTRTTAAHVYSFPISVTYHGVLPILPNQLSKDEVTKLNQYAFELATPADKDPHLWANNAFTDTYATGKLFGAEAQLIKIANQLNNTTDKNYSLIRDQQLLRLKQQMNSFLTGKVHTTCPTCKENDTAAWFFTYNAKWNTFLGFPSGFFTATTLTDHYFHYGYFLDAAATIAQFDKQWAQQYGAMINTLVRDLWDYTYDQSNVKSPNSLVFAHFKSFDPYAGISSALGLPWSPDHTNEEDSAEFMNFAQSLILWGTNTTGVNFDGDAITEVQQLRDLGLYLYTTEQQGLSYYHFNQHPDAGVFPENWVNTASGQKNLIIGNVWGGKLDRSTYFCAGQQTCYYENLASNTFPMTSGSFYLGLDPNFVLSAYQDDAQSPCSTSNNDLNQSAYCATLLKYLALGDANMAQKNFTTYFANPKNTLDPGNTLADTYYWISNFQ
ncbi:MAG: hypothetical protein JO149_06625, partial [Gammaproteobacteria bacterium]|nr:hypothetical protein [Gammaproteobacteria bacterium]